MAQGSINDSLPDFSPGAPSPAATAPDLNDAARLTKGTLGDSRLSSNVALKTQNTDFGSHWVKVVDEAYDATNFNGSNKAVTQNAVRDKIEAMIAAEAAQTYTPAWTQPAGTQPALGNGTIEGLYSVHGNFVNVTIVLICGTTTTYGNGANAYNFSLPVAAGSGISRHIGVAFLSDSSVPSTQTCVVEVASGASVAVLGDMVGGTVRSDSPFIFATGDRIYIQLSYHT